MALKCLHIGNLGRHRGRRESASVGDSFRELQRTPTALHPRLLVAECGFQMQLHAVLSALRFIWVSTMSRVGQHAAIG